jgi:hypothetical protein
VESAHVLANGLRLVTVPRPASPLACVVLRVGVGSADEEGDEQGLAHVLEHLVVRCALDGGRVNDGALVKASTGKECTVFSVVVREADLAAAVATVGSVFCDLRVPPVALAAELAAIREERRQRAAEPAWRVQNALFGALWAGSRAEHPVFGDPEVVDALTPARLGAFHAAWYRPAAATLAIAADPRTVSRAVVESACRWRDRREVVVPPVPPRALAGPATTAIAAGREPMSGLGFVVDGTGEPEAVVLACDAVLAASGLRITTLPLRGWLCVWAMVAGVQPGQAGTTVRAALASAGQRLTAPDGASWLRAEAVIPRLRTESSVEALATRAADPRTLIDAGRLSAAGPASVLRVLEAWSRRLAAVDVDVVADAVAEERRR